MQFKSWKWRLKLNIRKSCWEAVDTWTEFYFIRLSPALKNKQTKTFCWLHKYLKKIKFSMVYETES